MNQKGRLCPAGCAGLPHGEPWRRSMRPRELVRVNRPANRTIGQAVRASSGHQHTMVRPFLRDLWLGVVVLAFLSDFAAAAKCTVSYPTACLYTGKPKFVVRIDMESGIDLAAFRIRMRYDTKHLDALECRKAGRTLLDPEPGAIDDRAGEVALSLGRSDGRVAIPAGTGEVAEIAFRFAPNADSGFYDFDFDRIAAADTSGRPLMFLLASSDSVRVEEGKATTFRVHVSRQPDAPVTVSVRMGDSGDHGLSVAPKSRRTGTPHRPSQ